MKHTFAVAFLFLFAASSFAEDPRLAKRNAIRELLKVIDGKSLMESMLATTFVGASLADGDPTLLDRVFARLDYPSYADDVYSPALDSTFTTEELQELTAFFKTKSGQKVVKLYAGLSVSMTLDAQRLDSIARELRAEDAQPWKRTMDDLRAIATAAEAYATDENKYPAVRSYDDLGIVLSPTYIRTLPPADAWGTPFAYLVSADRQHYRFVSAGADQRFEPESLLIEDVPAEFQGRLTAGQDADIIFQDGTFVQFPSAARKLIDHP
jgi:uncharacterized protein DUF2059/type II secretion system (T2SS) protein G